MRLVSSASKCLETATRFFFFSPQDMMSFTLLTKRGLKTKGNIRKGDLRGRPDLISWDEGVVTIAYHDENTHLRHSTLWNLGGAAGFLSLRQSLCGRVLYI